MPIPNNPDYEMPDDSFFKFYFLTHKNSIFNTKTNLHFGEIVTAFLNIPVEDIGRICELSISLAKFSDEMYIKNEQSLTEFVRRIVVLQEIAAALPPYCYTNIDLTRECKRAERMTDKYFFGQLYDTASAEYAEFNRYKSFFSAYGLVMYCIWRTLEELSDCYLSTVPKRCEDAYTAAWGAFNEQSLLYAELQVNLPNLDRVQFLEGLDMRLCMSGMRDPENKDKLIMVDTCEFYNAHSVIRFDFFKAVQHSCVPIRCQNCGRFFLVTDSYRTFYCNGKSPENPDRTCRQMGAKNKHKEKAEHNPILQTYSKARNRYYQQFYRGYLSEEDYHKIQRYLETMRDRAIRGKTDENGELITYRMLEEHFKKDTLYKKLGIGGQS